MDSYNELPSSFYDEDDINEQHARAQYDTLRDAFAQVLNNEMPLSRWGIAYAISDSLDYADFVEVMEELKDIFKIRTKIELEKVDMVFNKKVKV